MSRFNKIAGSLPYILCAGLLGWLAMVQAETVSPGSEQQQMQLERERRESAKRVEAPKKEANIEVGTANVADEKIAAASAEVRGGAPMGEAAYGAVSDLSDAADAMTLLIGSIRVPEDAPISKYEMETLVESFQNKDIKLSQLIYLTENIAQLYASAENVGNLTLMRTGFDDNDSSRASPTVFMITKINVPENAAISREEVEALVRPYENKDLTLGEIRAFAKNIDKIYLSAENISAIASGEYQPSLGSASGSRKSAWKAAKGGAGPEGAGLPAVDTPFLIKKIDVEGNTKVSTSDIQAITLAYEGKQMKLEEAKAIAAEITRLYRAKGFVTCRAYIPPQNMSDNTLKIQVLEGKLGKVKVQGNKYFDKRLIQRFVNHEKGKVLEYSQLAKDITKANLHPDREVKAVIVPGQTVGTSDLILDVKDELPLHIGGEINNFGTKFTGQERYNVWLRHTNLTNRDDILATRLQFGEEVFAVGSQYVVPVGDWGTQLGAGFNYTDVNIGKDFAILDLGGKAYAYSAFVNQPFYSDDHFDLTWTGGFESKTIDNTALGATSSKDELRMFRTGINIDETDPYGRTFIVNDFVFGVGGFGASDEHDPLLSREDAGAPFFKYNGAINRVQPIADSTYLLLKGAGQFSPDRFVSAEQFDIGGFYSVRGYPQSDYLGDHGLSGSAELRVPMFFLPRELMVPGTQDPLWNKLSIVGFLDGGYAVLRNPVVGEFESRNFWGLGTGLRLDLGRNLSALCEWAAPLGDDPADGSNGQFYFSVNAEI